MNEILMAEVIMPLMRAAAGAAGGLMIAGAIILIAYMAKRLL